ncbi:helix-turn-helix domain-containing protein [Virgibacillus doumboii]|uniref:helix-turn-helix domain-containing protein n=1 Tax=Virgibacillus doumboii TaxID=2697503 RepID=UPI0013E02E11|nr:helix-turn-helix domain-containing protein [Virgibacillus doumboii]
MLFDRIVILCSSQFKNGRSVSAIYHLLKGKRSIQTVQDAHIYRLDNYYGIYKTLRKQDFDEQINKLVSNNLILLDGESTAKPADSGYKLLEETEDCVPLSYFNGMKYYNSTQLFFERLMLLIQTVTNSVKGNLNFIPVVDKPVITGWVKKRYFNVRQYQKQYLNHIHDELYTLLNCFSDREASMFVDCITGFRHYGMSTYQLADHYEVCRINVPLILTAVIQQMLSMIEHEKGKYPLLSSILSDMVEDSKLTKSAQRTNELLRKQYSAEEIAAMRNLKLNTIYDHLVEIALYDSQFPLETYIDEQQRQEILTAVNKLNSYKLKEIKQEIDERISYFQIRLVLAVEKIS